jgi:signal transduction histidine kinase
VFADTVFFMSHPGYIGKIYKDSVYYWSRPIFPAAKGEPEKLITFARKGPDGSLMFCIDDERILIRTKSGDFWIDYKKYFQSVKSIFDYKGKTWFHTGEKYFTLDMRNRTFVPAQLSVKNRIVHYDESQDIFWTMDDGNLLKEFRHKGEMKIDTVLRGVVVTQVMVDSEGNTWFGSDASGLYKYFIQDFDRCSSDRMRGVMAIFTDRDGARWIGTAYQGLWRIHKGKISSYSAPDTKFRNGFFNINQGPDGTLWAGSSAGLGQYDPVKDKFTWREIDPTLEFKGVISIDFDETGGMWLGLMGGGVAYYDGKKFTRLTEKEGLSTDWTMSLVYLKKFKTVFVGDEYGVTTIQDKKITQLDVGMDNTSVVALATWRDSLVLVSTGGVGVKIYDPQTGTTRSITTKEGLASDFIYFCAPDRDGYLWVGSERGITRIKLNSAFEVVENLHFDYDNGLVGVETNQNAYNFDGENKYFGLIDGLYQYNDAKRDEVNTYGVHLTNVELSYGQYPITEFSDSTLGFFKIPSNPSLPPDKNHVTFHFNRVDKRYPKSVKFKYMLEGYEDTWSLASSSTRATYGNLPPGDYVFKVMSTDNNGSWQTQPLSYSFTVEHPFYATVWFYVLVFVVIGVLITLVLYLRVRQRVQQVMMMERFRIKEQENLRKEIARDFHDEMGNQLTRIINYVSLLRLKSQEEVLVPSNGHTATHHHDLYTKVEDSAKYLYNGTRDFIWSIDPGNDELSKLFLHIRDFGEKLFEEKDIKFRAFNEIRDPVKLQYGFSREANLIFKEVMTNAFKYSNARNVAFTLKRIGVSQFEFCFEDDGVGFTTPRSQSSGGGLKNIHERAIKINGVLRITSIPESGTTITLSFTTQTKLTYGITL